MGRYRLGLLAVAGIGFFVSGVVLFWPARPAAAHAVLMHTTPAAGTILATAPSEVTLRFSEPVRPVADRVRVVGPAGERADSGQPSSTGLSLALHLRPALATGTFLVSYRVVSADGHPVAGGFTFSIGEPSLVAGSGGTRDGDNAAVDPTVSVAMPVARYLGFAGLALVAGPALFLCALWPPGLARRSAVRLAMVGFGILGAGTLGELYLQAPYAAGGSLLSASDADLTQALDSKVGLALLARLGILVAAVPLLRGLAAPAAGAAARWAFLTVAAVGLLTWPLSGHASSSPVPGLTVLTDAVHVAAMATWLGGLVLLTGLVLRRAADDELPPVLTNWSRWALVAVAALGLAGLAQAVVEVGSLDALVGTRYGLLLIAKVGLFVLILGAASIARAAVRRSGGVPRRRLRRAVAVEVALASVVLGLTAVLVQTAPARNADASTASTFQVTLGTAVVSLRVEITPARVGANTVTLTAFNPDGKPLWVLTWFASATLPSRGLAPIAVSLAAQSFARAAGAVNLPVAGAWRFRFALRVSGQDPAQAESTSVNAIVRVGPG